MNLTLSSPLLSPDPAPPPPRLAVSYGRTCGAVWYSAVRCAATRLPCVATVICTCNWLHFRTSIILSLPAILPASPLCKTLAAPPVSFLRPAIQCSRVLQHRAALCTTASRLMVGVNKRAQDTITSVALGCLPCRHSNYVFLFIIRRVRLSVCVPRYRRVSLGAATLPD